MATYLLKSAAREEGPFTEEQVSQLFADGRVNRDTPCKLATGGDWKTIDDYLPMLKYGTQLPAPSAVVRSEEPPPYRAGLKSTSSDYRPTVPKISVVDIDLPFLSILKLLFKWMAAALLVGFCLVPVALVALAILTAIFGGVLNALLPGFPHR